MQDDEISSEETGDDLTDVLNNPGETEFVTEEPKQGSRGTLAMGLLVAAAVGGMYVMHVRSGPASAMAAPETVAAGKTINSFLSDNQGLRTMQLMLKNTEKQVQQFTHSPDITQVALSDLKTNPFRFAPVIGNETAEQARQKHEKDHAAAAAAAKKLQGDLQSIVTGATSTCLIGNTMYSEGDTVDGLVIEKIDGKSVTVRQGVFRFSVPIGSK